MSADSGGLDLLGGVDIRGLHGGAFAKDKAADRSPARLHQSGAAGEDDLDLRPDVGRAPLRQSDRRAERKRSRSRGRALRQGGALCADGRRGFDPEGAMDHARSAEFSGKISHSLRRAYPAAAAAAAVSEILSRRRLAGGVANVGKTFRRASVLGRPAGADRSKHRRDQGNGKGGWSARSLPSTIAAGWRRNAAAECQLSASATVTSPILVQVSPPHSIPITQPRTSSLRGAATITSLE